MDINTKMNIKISEIMAGEPISVDKDDSLERVINLMHKYGISKFPVTDNKKLIGIISDEEIVDKLGAIRTRLISPSALHVSSLVRKETQSLAPDDDLGKALEIFKQAGVGILPIVEDNSIVGVLTNADLLKLVSSKKKLEKIMQTHVHAVSSRDRVIYARKLMLDNHVERIPVLIGGKVVGILAAMDLAFALDALKRKVERKHQSYRLKNLLAEDIMRRDVITARVDLEAGEAARIMYENDIGCLPVVDGLNKIKGIVARIDMIREIDMQ